MDKICWKKYFIGAMFIVVKIHLVDFLGNCASGPIGRKWEHLLYMCILTILSICSEKLIFLLKDNRQMNIWYTFFVLIKCSCLLGFDAAIERIFTSILILQLQYGYWHFETFDVDSKLSFVCLVFLWFESRAKVESTFRMRYFKRRAELITIKLPPSKKSIVIYFLLIIYTS